MVEENTSTDRAVWEELHDLFDLGTEGGQTLGEGHPIARTFIDTLYQLARSDPNLDERDKYVRILESLNRVTKTHHRIIQTYLDRLYPHRPTEICPRVDQSFPIIPAIMDPQGRNDFRQLTPEIFDQYQHQHPDNPIRPADYEHGDNLLFHEIAHNNRPLLLHLLRDRDWIRFASCDNDRYPNAVSPLFLASFAGKYQLVEDFINAGIDVNLFESRSRWSGRTAYGIILERQTKMKRLSSALTSQLAHVIQLLRQHGARLTSLDRQEIAKIKAS
jgi:hypothetical protein